MAASRLGEPAHILAWSQAAIECALVQSIPIASGCMQNKTQAAWLISLLISSKILSCCACSSARISAHALSSRSSSTNGLAGWLIDESSCARSGSLFGELIGLGGGTLRDWRERVGSGASSPSFALVRWASQSSSSGLRERSPRPRLCGPRASGSLTATAARQAAVRGLSPSRIASGGSRCSCECARTEAPRLEAPVAPGRFLSENRCASQVSSSTSDGSGWPSVPCGKPCSPIHRPCSLQAMPAE
mmetsp:Transcript_30873/g.81044  ORF Transcript_30873/g.81044 Transcript_30873/m.81044 type:complete len:246 (+) Transcript_30873:5-742(+)